MTRRIFIDSDIILDFILRREPFDKSASELFYRCERNEFRAFTTSIVISNVYYIASKDYAKQEVLKMIDILVEIFEIIPTNNSAISEAIHSKFTDFEDALQNFSAVEMGLEAIITRNIRDYRHSALQILTAEELIKQ